MLLEVHQNVDEGVTYRTRRRQSTRVVPPVPNPAASAEYAVHRAGEANGETANATGERLPVVRLDDEAHVFVLDSELEHAKARPGRRAERTPNGRKHAVGSETAKRVHRA